MALLATGARAAGSLAASYRRRLEAAATGFRQRRANEPRHLWPAKPPQRSPIEQPQGPAHALLSPDGRLRLVLQTDPRALCWSLYRNSEALIAPSRLGFAFRDAPDLEAGLKIVATRRRTVDDKWEQPWGECRVVRDHFNELTVELADPAGRSITYIFRLFNDGLGFRAVYDDPSSTPQAILDERTEFVLAEPDDSKLWWLPGWGFARDEYLYRSSNFPALLDEPDARSLHTPLTIRTPKAWLCLHEAGLEQYAGMNLSPQPAGILRADLVPWSDGDRVKIERSFKTPWRVVQVAERAHELIASTLLLSLNEPARFTAPNFKPGKYIGIWWGYILNYWDREPGAHYGATTDRALAYIDFAAEHGFGLLIESWNRGWEAWRDKSGISYSQPSAMFDEARVLAHARKRGVDLIGHHETSGDVARYESLWPEAFESLSRWHAKLLKTGYVAAQPGIIRQTPSGPTREWHYGQFMVEHQQRLADLAARRGIAVISHESVKDTGLRRTYPNLISRECAIGQEYNGFDVIHRGTPPDHEPTLAFTRMLSGPMDYTPGIFDLDLSNLRGERAQIRAEVMPGVRPNSTLARQLALYVVLYSPMQMAADFIENYRGHPAFKFIQDVPTDWERTVPLDGAIGEYVVIARKDRTSANWFLGAITNAKERAFTCATDFLDADRDYHAEIYGDAPESHFATRPKAWRLETRTLRRGDPLTMRMAPGGGCAIRLTPIQSGSSTGDHGGLPA